MSVYLRGVEDAFDLHEIGDVPGVLGERAQRKSIIPHKRWHPHEKTKRQNLDLKWWMKHSDPKKALM